ncbi:MAG: NAD(P)H-dependent oxidoreductase [Burkholderiales bacterium]|nr:NAD(P)H-dependent oxidoreductase [Burkholderiales bacterium]
MMNIQVLAICGSLRKNSTNMGMLRYARDHAPPHIDIEIADITAFPFYRQDVDDKPSCVLTFFEQLKKADALLLGCAEYNYSVAPALKNALDWASREKDNYLLAGKTAAMMGAGGGMGTSRAQYHLRQIAVILNLRLLTQPEVFASAFGDSFDDEGNLVNERIQGSIAQQLDALYTLTLTLKGHA